MINTLIRQTTTNHLIKLKENMSSVRLNYFALDKWGAVHDCPCYRYSDNCGWDNNRCTNIETQNFIFPEWQKNATDSTMKNTFHNMDSLMPSTTIIKRNFTHPEVCLGQELFLELWDDDGCMLIAANEDDLDYPEIDRSEYDYTYKEMVPFIDEDTLETIAIPEDYQIPIIAKPNPFNTEVSISFELEMEEKCKVSIYDMEGSLREVIFDGIVSSRSKTLSWQCSSCPSGTYFVVVTTPSTYSTKKINLVK